MANEKKILIILMGSNFICVCVCVCVCVYTYKLC